MTGYPFVFAVWVANKKLSKNFINDFNVSLKNGLSNINKALKKIEDGTYGYCEETMEPISIERLKARPIATLSLEAQEMHEKFESMIRFEKVKGFSRMVE